REAMYSRTVALGGKSGLGPRGLARGVDPRPFTTYSFSVFGLKRTDVGYMPVGMKPSGLALPGALTLKTATLFASALATNSIWPFGVRARLFGVLPLGALGYRAHAMVSRFLPSARRMTLTLVELAHAT